jgi:primosomal protein N' (replication factor Y)
MLNGRRVGGWITHVSRYGEGDDSGVTLDRLMPIMSVSGLGVEPELIPLTKWISERWWGSWRSVLSSASASRMRERIVHSRRTRSQDISTDAVSVAAFELFQSGGGLLVVPPALSSLAVVLRLACVGPVLVICPSQKMASMGAAFLRRKGLSTALVPDEWDSARGGVDVVIGTRSGVFAPCPDVVAVVVIDEHDELLKEERSPAWDATAVASERARRAGVPFICTSAVPSAQSLHVLSGRVKHVDAEKSWPKIMIVNLSDIPVARSLLSSELLEAVSASGDTTVCVLNTKGKARLIVCKSCRHVQACPLCGSLLTYDEDNNLWCVRCQDMHGGVCLSCGRSAFTVPRGGVSQLVSQIQASTRNPVIEISSDSPDDWSKGTVAVLHRIPTADTVVFADIDRDLGVPRLTGAHEVLSMIAKAARMVGANGTLVIQTRQVDNPLIVALSQSDVSAALQKWNEADSAQRRAMTLPPFGAIARVSVTTPRSITEISLPVGTNMARDDDAYLLRAPSREELDAAVTLLRAEFGTSIRIHIDPYRF